MEYLKIKNGTIIEYGNSVSSPKDDVSSRTGSMFFRYSQNRTPIQVSICLIVLTSNTPTEL